MVISAGERDAFRLTVAERETPRALAVTGVCFLAITLANALFGPPMAPGVLLVNASVAALLLGGGALVHTTFMRGAAWPWVAAACALAMVVAGQLQVWASPDGAAFAYVLLIVVAYGPLTLAWAPTAVAAVPMLVGCVVVSQQWAPDAATDWVIASVAAVALGMTLLWLRLRSIDELAEMAAEIRSLATRDRLTGSLNRLGIEERIPELVGMAERYREPVFAMFLDIDGLKQVNDRHGHHVGDRVITTVCDAVRGSVRVADLVGRWGGDEFIVLGLGTAEHPDHFADRILERIRTSGADPSRSPLEVSVGTATLACEALDMEVLIRKADEDMYARRRARRAA